MRSQNTDLVKVPGATRASGDRSPLGATAYGAAQDQSASTAAPGQRFLLLWVVLAALVAGLFAYWLRHKGLENRVKALGKLVEQRETELTEADQKLKRLARLGNVTEIPNHSRLQEFLRDE